MLGGEQRLRIRCLLVHRNAHVVDRVDDVFDLLRIDDLGGQVIVHLRIGEVALFLAARDQQLQLRLAILRHDRGARRRRWASCCRPRRLCRAALPARARRRARPRRLSWAQPQASPAPCRGSTGTFFECGGGFDRFAVGGRALLAGGGQRLVLACRHGARRDRFTFPYVGPRPGQLKRRQRKARNSIGRGGELPNSACSIGGFGHRMNMS